MSLEGKKILIVGASSDIAADLNTMLIESGATVGFHYNRNEKSLSKIRNSKHVKKFQKNLKSFRSCYELVDDFINWAKGIDYLVQLCGDIKRPVHWENLTEEDWHYDLGINLIMPFFLVQRAMLYMRDTGGRIILISTASASHGGGTTSFAYGVAKAGIECMVKGLARDCAKFNVLVNAIALGVISTKFHTEKMKRTKEQLEERIKLIPLNRAGTTKEFASTVMFLLSENASYINGQIIAVSGGDWL